MTHLNHTERFLLVAAALIVIMAFAACPPPAPPPPLDALTLLPTDACASSSCMPPSPFGLSDVCTVTPTLFATWFESGTPSVNGVVKPADSVNFPNTPNCSFYQWAKQDFLWLTSPTTSAYGGSGLIVDSPAFYDVSPPAGGSRTFLPHSAGFIRPFALRSAQAGARGLQLLFDRSGKPFEFAPAKEDAKPIVRDVTGKTVEIAHARIEKGSKLILLDVNGKVIQVSVSGGGKRTERAQVDQMATAQRFMIDRIPIFIDPSLAVIDVEQGEAGGNGIGSGVLEAQAAAGGSLVYYATIVNDVYAYFATGVKNGQIALGTNSICNPAPNNCFPITAADLGKITSFASNQGNGKTFPDPNALAIEVKSAWVEAAGLPNLSGYITMIATIPTYTPPTPTSTTTVMTPAGQKTVKLALVGMHVVGSVAGHPEMIWATFEHVANAPAGDYSYINNTGTSTSPGIATVKQTQSVSTLPVIGGVSTPWLFSSTTASSFNTPHMNLDSPPNINANTGFTISPSDTIRWKAFGGASDILPNPVDPSTAVSNTEIITINNSITGITAFSGDVRNNYVMTGATWTVGGFSPTGGGASNNCGVNNGCPVGTSALANTTMETYQQGKDNTLANGGSNCFTCHTSNTTDVSHVFFALKPLF